MYQHTGGRLKRIQENAIRRMARLQNPRARLEFIDARSFALATPLSNGGSVGGGSVDPPPPDIGEVLFYPLTIPNNSTETLDLYPAEDFGAIQILGSFTRGSMTGWFRSMAAHDGSTGTHSPVESGEVSPNFNDSGFALSITAGVVTLTFAADNSGNDIACMLAVTRVPQP